MLTYRSKTGVPCCSTGIDYLRRFDGSSFVVLPTEGGGGKRGKVGPKLAPESFQNEANLAQGGGKGFPKINKTMNK